MIVLDYICNACGETETNQTMESFQCSCGGDFKLVGGPSVPATTFDPHYCPIIKQHVSSWSDQEKKAKAFRSPDHPEGFTLLQGNKKYMNHLKKVYKNREDVKAEQYSKDGIKYPKGKEVFFNEQEGRFINKKTKEPIDSKRISIPTKPLRASEKVKLKTVAIWIGLMLIASSSFAKVDGVPYVTITVKGHDYDVPIHEPDFKKEDAKLILDLLDGNKNARKVLLSGADHKIIFIGDGDKARWLYITKDDQWVK